MSARRSSILLAFETALLATFVADAPLCALVRGRIHGGSPRGPVLPYLAFAEARCGDFSSGDGDGAAVALTLEAVTDDGDRARALAIVDAALERALGADLTLTVGAMVLLKGGETRLERSRDGKGWRATVVLNALVDG